MPVAPVVEPQCFPGERREEPGLKILTEDPLVRWLIWLMVALSVGVPVIAALVMSL